MQEEKKCFVIGITGGAGAGKSQVLEWFAPKPSVLVIQADQVGHFLREPGKSIYRWMIKEYGPSVLLPDQTINPAAVAAIAFSDPQKAKRINSCTHPLIREEIIKRMDAFRGDISKEGSKTIILEAALLSEGGLSELCDEVWYVCAPKEIRIDRMMQSRGYSRERCEAILARQKTDAQFRAEADRVIDNSGRPEETHRQLEYLWKEIGGIR